MAASSEWRLGRREATFPVTSWKSSETKTLRKHDRDKKSDWISHWDVRGGGTEGAGRESFTSSQNGV